MHALVGAWNDPPRPGNVRLTGGRNRLQPRVVHKGPGSVAHGGRQHQKVNRKTARHRWRPEALVAVHGMSGRNTEHGVFGSCNWIGPAHFPQDAGVPTRTVSIFVVLVSVEPGHMGPPKARFVLHMERVGWLGAAWPIPAVSACDNRNTHPRPRPPAGRSKGYGPQTVGRGRMASCAAHGNRLNIAECNPGLSEPRPPLCRTHEDGIKTSAQCRHRNRDPSIP